MAKIALFFVVMLASSQFAQPFYLPGVAPRRFVHGEEHIIKVNTMTSPMNPLRFDYFSVKNAFCMPEGGVEEQRENLGEVLAGERSELSVYKIQANVTQQCILACKKSWSAETVNRIIELSKDEYRVNMRLDNLPVAEFTDYPEHQIVQLGFPISEAAEIFDAKTKSDDTSDDVKPAIVHLLFNHLKFVISYHSVSSDNVLHPSVEEAGILIVGFAVIPASIHHEMMTTEDPCGHDTAAEPIYLIEGTAQDNIGFTYDVEWKVSDTKWASRWDVYLTMHEKEQVEVHWFSIFNAFIIVFFLSSMIAMIMIRILRKDLYQYNELSQSDDAQEEAREDTGWKLVYADVFRTPVNATLLAVLSGSGLQILLMLLITLFFSVLGLLSPSNRGSLMTCVVIAWIIMGFPAGYVAAVFCKLFKASDRWRNTLFTATFVPGVVFTVFFVLNFFIWGEKSAGAVPFTTMFAILMLWFGISLPLVFCGSFAGFKGESISIPCRINAIPRAIPEQNWLSGSHVTILIGGILPFGAVFVELYFIVSSIWLHQFYYVFGFLALVVIILVVTCAEISIVLCYFQLCNEHYHWWWRSFLVSGSSAVSVCPAAFTFRCMLNFFESHFSAPQLCIFVRCSLLHEERALIALHRRPVVLRLHGHCVVPLLCPYRCPPSSATS
jgi:transmembrane 9 superfamily protein 2/4